MTDIVFEVRCRTLVNADGEPPRIPFTLTNFDPRRDSVSADVREAARVIVLHAFRDLCEFIVATGPQVSDDPAD